MPETSVVIRTFNEEKHSGNLLAALAEQTYRDYEVIIVDSGSSDKTLEIARAFPTTIIEIPSRDFTFGYSLNVGCKAARGQYLVFVSAHILPVSHDWLGNLIAGFTDKKVAMVYGRQVGAATSKFSEKRDFIRLFGESPENTKVPSPYANNANAAVRRDAWERHPFDEYLFGLEDIDFARKCEAEGLLVRYAPSAAIYHIHAERWPQVFNRYRREAIAAVRIGLTAPPQAGLSRGWFAARLAGDLLATFPHYGLARLKEIFRFRYYQWKGSRVGFAQGKPLKLQTERNTIFSPVTARALMVRDAGAAVEPVELPALKPSEILVNVDYVLVSPHDAESPTTAGRLFSGTIERIGASNRFQERHVLGQRVIGLSPAGGAYASHVIISGSAICPVPDAVAMQAAPLVGHGHVDIRSIEEALVSLEDTDATPMPDMILPLEDFERAWQVLRDTTGAKILLKP